MARPTLFSNRKFLRLAQRLQSEALALGHLEYLWHAANEIGNPVLGDADDVEVTARWRGARGELVAALMECGSAGSGAGFIKRRSDGLYEIHDYWHHAPDYVRKRAKREQARRDSGDKMLPSDRSVTGQNGLDRSDEQYDRSASGQSPVSDRSVTGQIAVSGCGQNGLFFRTPAPAPAHEEVSLTVISTGEGSSSRAPGARRATRSKPIVMPDDWEPHELNHQWLKASGLTDQQATAIIGEFRQWARLTGNRKAVKNWDLAFYRNPVVRKAVGRALSGARHGPNPQRTSAYEESRERLERWAAGQGIAADEF
jgi:hypothetical protein